MQSFMYTIKIPVGMHARHAGILVKEAQQFQSQITFSKGDRSASCQRILGLMGLGVKQGDLVKLTFEGPDEDAAAAHMKRFMWEHF